MSFDYTTATQTQVFDHPVEVKSALKPADYVAVNFWEEHCVECGAPACYGTCNKFVKGPTGRCRRLLNGIEPIVGKRGMAAMTFSEWGKLELRHADRMILRSRARILEGIDHWAYRGFRAVGLLQWYLDIRCRAFCHFSVRDIVPEWWEFGFWVEKEVDLIAAIVDDSQGELLTERIKVAPGWHHYRFAVPKLAGASHFRISAINGTDCPVVFSYMNVFASPKRQIPADFVKCVAWDLDNTLWDGVLANDGAEVVKLREQAIEAVKALDQRGILNTICSKNDYDVAWKTLEALGVAEYFVFPQINWNPKSANLKNAAKEINIGIDTFAFVDDSAHERGEVAEHLPMVRVFNDTEIEELLVAPCCNPPQSAESAKRRFSYLAEMSRRSSEQSFDGDHDAFLRSCEIVLTLEPLTDAAEKKRCWELVNRTNQLTLAARRYTEESFAELVAKPDGKALVIRCKDKYGDYGIVGFIAVVRRGDAWEVAEFVMSCRVAMKKCEFATIDHIAGQAAGAGAMRVYADVIETGRNKALVKAFDEMPGVVREKNGVGLRYVIELGGRMQSDIPVKVVG